MPLFRTSSTRGLSNIPENNIYRNDDDFPTDPPDDTDPPTNVPVCIRNPLILVPTEVAPSLDFSDEDNSQYYVLGVL
jgi:hypothetical protein